MPLTKTKTVLGVTGTIIGLVAGGWGLWEKIENKLDENRKAELEAIKILVDQRVQEYYSQKKGSLSHSIGDGLNVDRDDVAKELVNLHKNFYEVYPTIKDETHITDVGLKRDAITGDIFYIHTDGKRKNVYYDPLNDWYYFMDESGNRRTCK